MTRIFFVAVLFFSFSAFSFFELTLPKNFSQTKRWQKNVEDLIRQEHLQKNIRYCAAVLSDDFALIRYEFYRTLEDANAGMFQLTESFGQRGTLVHVFDGNYRIELDMMTGIFLF